jgi:hypothetical protein
MKYALPAKYYAKGSSLAHFTAFYKYGAMMINGNDTPGQGEA